MAFIPAEVPQMSWPGSEFEVEVVKGLLWVVVVLETPVKEKKALTNTLEKESAKRLQRATPKWQEKWHKLTNIDTKIPVVHSDAKR